MQMAYASVVGATAVIRGNVRGDTSLEILGRVEGDVSVSGDLSLGPDAVVVGAVSGARVVIAGSVEGDVTGVEAVLVEETGRVIGDLSAPRIGMSEGAHVRGGVRTEGAAAAGTSGSRGASRATESRASEARAPERHAEARNVTPAPVDRAVQRSVSSNGPAAPPPSATGLKPPVRKAPPPPVIKAPRPGARAKKKLARR
jgi:cytoskeletal protein CcmA (bactofilin family)